jgi:hypothetical protein
MIRRSCASVYRPSTCSTADCNGGDKDKIAGRLCGDPCLVLEAVFHQRRDRSMSPDVSVWLAWRYRRAFVAYLAGRCTYRAVCPVAAQIRVPDCVVAANRRALVMSAQDRNVTLRAK